MGAAIRAARQAIGLTQTALGPRLGLVGRAVYRWERGEAVPSPGNQRALITLVQSLNQPAAVRLSAELASAASMDGKAAPLAVASPVPVELSMDLAVFSLAEDLALAPRVVRSALLPFFQRLRALNLGADQAASLLESRLQPPPPGT